MRMLISLLYIISSIDIVSYGGIASSFQFTYVWFARFI